MAYCIVIIIKLQSCHKNQEIKLHLAFLVISYLRGSTEFEFTPNTEIPNPLPCFFLKKSKNATQQPSIMDIAASVAPNSICMFRSPMASPTHSPGMKRRSETGPAAYRHNVPDGLPTRRLSSVDISSVNEKLESLRNDKENNNKVPLRRRTTVAGMCPMFKTNSFNRDESFDEDEDDDEEIENGDGEEINCEASLIGMDEESLTELVELSQQIEANL